MDPTNTKKNSVGGHQTGSIIEAIGLTDFFVRADQKGAEKLAAQKASLVSPKRSKTDKAAESTSTQQPAIETLPNPIDPDRTIKFETFRNAFINHKLLRKLFGLEAMQGSQEFIADILAQSTAADTSIATRSDSEQQLIDAFAGDYLRTWHIKKKLYKPTAVQSAALEELRNVWFASCVLVAHQRLKDDPAYQREVAEAKEVLGLMDAKVDAETVDYKTLDLEVVDKVDPNMGPGEVCAQWTYEARLYGLDAVRGLLPMNEWWKSDGDGGRKKKKKKGGKH